MLYFTRKTARVAAATSGSSATGGSASADTSISTITSLTSGTVSTGNGDVLQGLNLSPDILGWTFAEDDFVVHLSSDMMDVVVDHGKGNAYRENGYDREGDCRIGNKAVSFDSVFKIHGATTIRESTLVKISPNFAEFIYGSAWRGGEEEKKGEGRYGSRRRPAAIKKFVTAGAL